MGSSKKPKPPAPPKIEAPIAPPEEVDLLNQEQYMRQREQDRKTLMTSPIEAEGTMMAFGSKKKKKNPDMGNVIGGVGNY